MDAKKSGGTKSHAALMQEMSEKDYSIKQSLYSMMQNAPIPEEEFMHNMALFIDRRLLSRYLFINEIYQKIINVHGNIFEFGVRYGQNLALMVSYRGIYEPYNHNRKIVGFDTFSGFPEVDKGKDMVGSQAGDFSVPKSYEDFLEQVLLKHEAMAPVEKIRKFELVKGDVTKTLPKYLTDNPGTMISMVYFDMDVYKPTKACLEAIVPYLTKGSVIAFDELNDPYWPGETMALREVLGTNNFRLVHTPFRGSGAYLVYE